MSSNADPTQVTLTIITFDETLAGEYCCSKESKKESTCQCVQKAEPLTPKPAPSAEAPTAPEVTQTQATLNGTQLDILTNSTGMQLGLYNWALTTCVPIFFQLCWMDIAY
ncbi:uncharacterized protein LOC127836322 [Dreissena polymorpha]|uniref:uncharacterized protein LOC127836322 n=1 Tax=Dreissena polymorpha TaxID=45954 RepID=UPI002263C585|nr:uncharacterized protein LOC127836322 [Dreissena polymorpha]